MFIISLNYVRSLEQIDALLEKHVEFLKDQYSKKNFIASGRKVPRTGGIILAKVDSREQLDAIIQLDPFYIDGVAEYEIIEFAPTLVSSEYQNLKE